MIAHMKSTNQQTVKRILQRGPEKNQQQENNRNHIYSDVVEQLIEEPDLLELMHWKTPTTPIMKKSTKIQAMLIVFSI